MTSDFEPSSVVYEKALKIQTVQKHQNSNMLAFVSVQNISYTLPPFSNESILILHSHSIISFWFSNNNHILARYFPAKQIFIDIMFLSMLYYKS